MYKQSVTSAPNFAIPVGGDLLVFGDRSWVLYVREEGSPPFVVLKVSQTPAGKFLVSDLRVIDSRGVTGAALRELPLGQIEQAINLPEYLEDLALWLKHDAERTAEDKAAIDKLLAIAAEPLPVTKKKRRRLDVPVPTDRKKPDEFYRRIADLYVWLLARGNQRPAAEIAEANEVPVTTVHRWIKEARRRGLLPPGQRETAMSSDDPQGEEQR